MDYIKALRSFISVALCLSIFLTNAQDYRHLRPEHSFAFQFGGGYSYLTFHNNSSNKILETHNGQLKKAYHFQASVAYFLTEDWLLSVNGSLLKSRAFTDDIMAVNLWGDTVFGFLEDRLSIHSVGLKLEGRLYDGEGIDLSYLIGVESFYYAIDGHFVTDDFQLSGSDISFHLGLNSVLPLTDRMFFGLQAQYISGILHSPDFQLPAGNFNLSVPDQNASRIELSAFLRFCFIKKRNGRPVIVPEKEKKEEEYIPNRFR